MAVFMFHGMDINDFKSLMCLGCLLLFATINNARRNISLYLSPSLSPPPPHFSFLAEGFKCFKVSYTDICFRKIMLHVFHLGQKQFSFKENTKQLR